MTTEIALHPLLLKKEEQMEDKSYALATFLDIKGAFGYTHYDGIEKPMSRKGFIETIIEWTQIMLSGRSPTAHYNGTLLSNRPARDCLQLGFTRERGAQ